MAETLTIPNETFSNLLQELQIPDYFPSDNVNALIAVDARYIRDLKVNVTNVLNNTQYLSRKEALMLALAVAINGRFDLLKESFTKLAREAGTTDAEIAEIVACTSLMNTNNMLYRFRHFVKKEFYSTQPAGVKMSIMMNPVLGKEFFELLSLVVSAVNGCEMCVSTHEKSVLQHGSTESRVFEAVKVGSVINGLVTVLS